MTHQNQPFLRSAVLTTLVFLALIAAFSPSLISFWSWVRVPDTFSQMIEVRRGASVVLQVVDPGVEITDPIHKIVRWRLLIPMLGHLLHLPPILVLAISPLSCLIVLFYLIRIARFTGQLPWVEAALLALVCGSGSWFFTSMGWLGYYDGLLALGLLAVTFSSASWPVIAACLAVPWIDERFVIGLPLALAGRFLLLSGRSLAVSSFLRQECILPVLLTLLYVPLRFWLSGRSGSSTVGGYFASVQFFHLSAQRVLFGMWEGLRVGWVPLLAGIWAVYQNKPSRLAIPLTGLLLLTLFAGLATANDLSRSMVVVLPMVPLGWILFRQYRPKLNLNVAWALAFCALLLPAHHVVSNLFIPIDSLWNEIRRLQVPPAPFAAETYLQRASLLSLPNDQEEFERCLRISEKLSPQNAEVMNQTAVILASKGRLEDAVGFLNQAIRIDPSNPNLWKNRSQVNLALGNLQAAEIDSLTAKSLVQ